MTPRIQTSDLYNTSVAFDNILFLKFYRKIERSVNPDPEMTRFLSKEGKFPYLPAFIGSIEWKDKKGCIVLGMLQEMIENHGDGYTWFLERVNNYIERIMAGEKKEPVQQERLGTLADPVAFEELSEGMQLLLGAHTADQARLIGLRTAEMHLALASGTTKEFKPEAFSLHYQRSLFSSMQSLIRETYQNLSRNRASLPTDMKERADQILAYRSELLATMKKIYLKKLDTVKIRIHGNYHLGQILLTGKDLAINDYSGDPSYSFSERRLRRSPFVDLASMIASIHHVAFEGFLHNQQLHEDDARRLLPMAGLWAHYVSGFFIRAYKEKAEGSLLIPAAHEDVEKMLQYFLVQKALSVFNGYLKKDPQRLIIPQTMLRSVLRTQPDATTAVPAAGGTPSAASPSMVS